MDQDIVDTSCAIIASVGSAKSSFIEAIRAAREGDIENAQHLIDVGREHFLEGYRHHKNLLQKFASGDKIEVNILLVHAECLMTSAEDFEIIAREYVQFAERDKS